MSHDAAANLPPRDAAFIMLTTYTESPALRAHALAVEAVMRRLAVHYGEDPDVFGMVGLLHDFDYERFPDVGSHTIEGGKILAAANFPGFLIEAIQSHVNENNIARDTRLKQAIYAADELTGLVVAVALVKGRNLAEVTVSSVMKKLKDKSFARGVNRADVHAGALGLGLSVEDLVSLILEALMPMAADIGLAAPGA
jgi:putative nucleotidyltransferase with HDIG domain